MTYNTTAIAAKLNILDSAIIEIQEWASVLFVKFVGGCRFVSKKIGANQMQSEYNWVAEGGVDCKAELITDRPHQMGCDYYKVSTLKVKKIVGKPSVSSYEFTQNVKADVFAAAMAKAGLG